MLGLQLAFAFFYSVFQGYAPDTDLDNVPQSRRWNSFWSHRHRLVFQYIWPEARKPAETRMKSGA